MTRKRINSKSGATSDAINEANFPRDKGSVSPTTLMPVLRRLSRNRLQFMLKERGLLVTGKKNNMINRLGAAMLDNSVTSRRAKEPKTSGSNGTQNVIKGPKSKNGGKSRTANKDRGKESEIEADDLTLWQHPVITLNYFLRELLIDGLSLGRKVLNYKLAVASSILIVALCFVSSRVSGPQQQIFQSFENKLIWWLYWVGLGVLSSVGLGTGLHTFVLYLGPHIAAVTIAAYECGSLNFPEPPYPDEIVCPKAVDAAWVVGILNIMRKVRVEAMLWGAGTALGELPPYFMARAARTSSQVDENEDLENLKDLEALEALESGENIPFVMRCKLAMKHFVEKAGFWGILACASIPNPLFDLAGLTCGHYLIPFWTFFGATLIGKAVIKMHIQQLAVIIAFNEELLDKVIHLLSFVPYVGSKFEAPLKRYLMQQKQKLHSRSTEGTTTIAWLFDKFVMLMVGYFLITLIHALARNHHRRRAKRTKRLSSKMH